MGHGSILRTPLNGLRPNGVSHLGKSFARHRFLIVGDVAADDFQEVVSWIRGHIEHSRIVEIGSLTLLENTVVHRRFHPDWIVVLQGWSDEYPADEILNGFGRCPLARWLCVYGPWCTSDGRTRERWPLSVRVPADQALAVLHHALFGHGNPSITLPQEAANPRFEKLAESPLVDVSLHDPTASHLPWTASRSEIYSWYFRPTPGSPRSRSLSGLTCYVRSEDRGWREMLTAALRSAGATIDADAVVATGTQGENSQTSRLRSTRWAIWDADAVLHDGFVGEEVLREVTRDWSVLAMISLMDHSSRANLIQLGCRDVISKVAPISLLLDRLLVLSKE